MPNEEISLTAFFAPIRKRWILVASVTAVVIAGAVINCITRAPKWEATAVILFAPNDQDMRSLPKMMSDQASPLSMMQGVLESRTGQDFVMQRLGLKRRALKRLRTITTDSKKNQLVITSKGTNKDQILAVAQESINALTEINRTVGFSMAQAQARYLEQAVRQKETDVVQAAKRLADFQVRMKTSASALDDGSVDPGEAGRMAVLRQTDPLSQLKSYQFQLDSVRRQIAGLVKGAQMDARFAKDLPTGLVDPELRKQLTDLQYRVKVARTQLGPKDRQRVNLEHELEVARQHYQSEIDKALKAITTNVADKVQVLREKEWLLDWQVSYLKEFAAAAPAEAIELQRLLAEVRVRRDVLAGVRQQYEKARIDAEVEKVRWGLLVAPSISDEPINKSVGHATGMGLMAGLIFSSCLAYLLEVAPSPARKGKDAV